MEINEMVELCHKVAKEKGFWEKERETGTILMLIVSELGEALEADRNNDFENFKEEIADTVIRIFDYCGYLKIDLEKEILKKYEKNKLRPYKHGKKY
ncbi:MAG TPA: nucleotide pyrophosphohydrolase [bacterium]|nr:nucleotide pyrophosphohydrolase [bacterium]HOL48480.1 nucleotide pyrophosphohydrolase [bacterium]HPQ17714.1 nucleotide pyrophosphohydrolase [bacterium]